MAGTPASGIAARGYSWPAFDTGHTKSLQHGARSERTITAVANQIYETVRNSTDWPAYLDEPVHQWAVRAWLRAEAVVHLLTAYLEDVDIQDALTETTILKEQTDSEGDKTAGRTSRVSTARRTGAALDYLRKWETQATNARTRLGLDPLSRARLGKDIASANVDLARIWAEQDAAENSGTATGEADRPARS
jgi:hypothetical protein